MASWIQRLGRIARHRWQEGQVRRAFPADVLQRLEAAVKDSETRHTGQIRLCVEGGLPYSYLLRDAPARERAITLFGKLRTWDTEHNNGVLIYLLMADHAIEIVADRGLARHVSQAQWQTLVEELRTHCRAGEHAKGMEAAIAHATALLVQHFPATGPAPADNALPDQPVVQGRFFKDV